LIINDDKQVRDLLSKMLAENHDCTLSSSAKEAMRVLKATKFAYDQ
jgi:DNA-binding NtrC family response regulator